MTTTKEQRAEWKALADAATPGPWLRLIGERTVYGRLKDGCRGNAIVRADIGCGAFDAANLDFIAAARKAVPALLADLEEAKLRAERLEVGYATTNADLAATRKHLEEAQAKLAAAEKDAERLNVLEKESKASRSGITISWMSQQYASPLNPGYRLMRYHKVFDAKPTLREAIDAAIAEQE